MKIILKQPLLIVFMLIALAVKADWLRTNVKSLPFMGATCIVNSQTRFAVNKQHIYKSEDAGLTWEHDTIAINNPDNDWVAYQSITFVDDNTGFIQVNIDSTVFVYKTNDIGWQWTPQKFNGTGYGIERIKFISEYNWIWYGGATMKVTTDGGLTWIPIEIEGADTAISAVEIQGNSEWYVEAGTHVFKSSDKGLNWDKIATLTLDEGVSGFNYPRYYYVGMSKISTGLLMLFNVYYSGCGSYYDHSVLCHLDPRFKQTEYKVTNTLVNFNYAPSCMYFKNDTGYISTMSDIYKCTEGSVNWFRTFSIDCYQLGYIEGIKAIDGKLWAYTNKGEVFINDNPLKDKNLAIITMSNMPNNVNIFPQPANEQLIFTDKLMKEGILIITDINGRQVYNTAYSEGTITIQTATMNSGIYIYSIQNNQSLTYGKFEIKH